MGKSYIEINFFVNIYKSSSPALHQKIGNSEEIPEY